MTRRKDNENAVICLDETGNKVKIENSGYTHFKERG